MCPNSNKFQQYSLRKNLKLPVKLKTSMNPSDKELVILSRSLRTPMMN